MSDPLRTDAPDVPDGAPEPDRDAKIERLLLVGLDHYFAAQYEQAINVWTRALFLDRSHARARAYIERARSALAEGQRESEELLQTGLAAFSRGEEGEARRLLHAALKQGAPPDEALAVLDRLSRLDPGPAREPPASAVRTRSLLVPNVHDRARTPGWGFAVSALAVAILAAGGVFVATNPIDWRSLFVLQPPQAQSPALASPLDSGLPIPLRGETALERARGLQARGHLRDALSALDLVRPTDAQKADADRLRAVIQQQLISLTSADTATPPESRKGGGPLP